MNISTTNLRRYLTQGVTHSLLVGSLCALLPSIPVTAQQSDLLSPAVIESSIKQLEIMAGDTKGNLNLDKLVTRAEFATMLVAASPHKNVTTQFGYTLFPDVPAEHWSSGYVKVVVEKGYMVGQVDGSFAPDRSVTLEEAVTAVLNLLGYNSTSLSGSYPQAQLAKYYELDLDEYMNASQGQAMTRESCMYLFFNLMNTAQINGTPYATQMGYATTSSGALDTLALTNSKTEGPFLVGTNSLPSGVYEVETFYKNDKTASASDIKHYDICYYNEKLSTVWVYDEKITGRLTSIDSLHSPTSVTVAGNSYSLETTDVSYQFAVGGSFQEGDLVTLLLGQYGKVADVVSATETDGTMVGLVLDNGITSVPNGDNTSTLARYATIVTTSGETRQFENTGLYQPGRVISVTYDKGVQTVKGISDKSITGKVNASSRSIGSHKLAEDAEIFEISGTDYTKIYLSRLDGVTLSGDDVRYYITNSKGEITSLMLEDVTGDVAKFGLVTKVTELNFGLAGISGQYTYMLNGVEAMEVSSGYLLNAEKGAVYFQYDDGELDKLINLESGTISWIGALETRLDGNLYTLAEDIQVYQHYKNTYQLSSLSDISETDRFDLTGYYDKDLFSAGNQVRVIVAEVKD